MISEITIADELTQIAGRYTPEERQRVLAERDHLIKELVDVCRGKGKIIHDSDPEYECVDPNRAIRPVFGPVADAYKDLQRKTEGFYAVVNPVEFLSRVRGSLKLSFNKVGGSPKITLSDPQGKIASITIDGELEDKLGFSFKDLVHKYWTEVKENSDAIKRTQDLNEIERLEEIRQESHYLGSNFLSRAFKFEIGITLGFPLAQKLFFILAYAYPHPKSLADNPFPKEALGVRF